MIVLPTEKDHTDRKRSIRSYFLLCCTRLPWYVTGGGSFFQVEGEEHEMEASGETCDQVDPPQVKRMNVFICFLVIYLFLLTVRFVFFRECPTAIVKAPGLVREPVKNLNPRCCPQQM